MRKLTTLPLTLTGCLHDSPQAFASAGLSASLLTLGTLMVVCAAVGTHLTAGAIGALVLVAGAALRPRASARLDA